MKYINAFYYMLIAFLVSFASFVFYFEINDKTILKRYIVEDGFSENITAALYILSCAVFLLSWHNKKNNFHLLLALLCFFIAGEELSWAQRIFNIETPSSLNRINIPQEINLHNLTLFSSDPVIPSSQRIFNGMMALFFLAMPISNLFKYPNKLFLKYDIPVYRLRWMGITLLILIVRILQKYTNHAGYFTDEVVELSASVGFWFYSISELDKCLAKTNPPLITAPDSSTPDTGRLASTTASYETERP